VVVGTVVVVVVVGTVVVVVVVGTVVVVVVVDTVVVVVVVGTVVVVVVVGAVVVVGTVVVVLDVVVAVVVVAVPQVIWPALQASITFFAHWDACFPLSAPHVETIWARHDGRLQGGGGSLSARAAEPIVRNATARGRTIRWMLTRMMTLLAFVGHR
jgi:hypothetical protein